MSNPYAPRQTHYDRIPEDIRISIEDFRALVRTGRRTVLPFAACDPFEPRLVRVLEWDEPAARNVGSGWTGLKLPLGQQGGWTGRECMVMESWVSSYGEGRWGGSEQLWELVPGSVIQRP
jgi:hypothetical protein